MTRSRAIRVLKDLAILLPENAEALHMGIAALQAIGEVIHGESREG